MTIRIDVEGSSALRAALRNMSDDIRAQVGRVVQTTGVRLHQDIIHRIQRGPATGRIYQRRGITHQASAPGEAPMSDRGNRGGLVSSIFYSTSSPLAISVYSNRMQAVWLEYGTRHIRERPAWTPAANKARKQFNKDIRRVVLGETR